MPLLGVGYVCVCIIPNSPFSYLHASVFSMWHGPVLRVPPHPLSLTSTAVGTIGDDDGGGGG